MIFGSCNILQISFDFLILSILLRLRIVLFCFAGRGGLALALFAKDFPSHTPCRDLGPVGTKEDLMGFTLLVLSCCILTLTF